MNALALCGALLFAVNASAAPAAVKRSSGPLEISFRVANPRKSAAELLLFSISLRNVGTTDFLLIDDVFSQPSKIAGNSVSSSGIYLELRDNSGRVRDIEAGDAVSRWPDDYSTTAPAPEIPREPLFLKPGKATTVPCAESVRLGGGEYCVLRFWLLDRRGHYWIRAVYNNAPPRSSKPMFPEEIRVATPWVSVDTRSRSGKRLRAQTTMTTPAPPITTTF